MSSAASNPTTAADGAARRRGLIAPLLSWAGPILVVVMLLLALMTVRRELEQLHLRAVLVGMQRVPAHAWLAALIATVSSYLLLGGYDWLALRYVRRPLGVLRTWFVAFIAYAFGHNLGLPAITAAAIRLRLYSAGGLGAPDIARIAAFCSLTSALGLATLFGIAALTETTSVAAALHVGSNLMQLGGAMALVGIAAYLLWAGNAARRLEFRGWSLSAPGARLALGQWLLGSADLALAAAALWWLLPPDVQISYASFAGVYVAAAIAGIISHVPAGLGVFEAVLLLALPEAAPDDLLGAMLAYRAVYYLLPLAAAIVLFGARELALQRKRLAPAQTLAASLITPVTPWVGGIAVFTAGCVLLVSGATPILDQRLQWLRHALPLPVLELSHLIASSIGIGLLVLAHGLTRRSRAAFQLTLLLLTAGAAASLFKGLDFEEALVLSAIATLLWIGRAAFYRPSALFADRFSPGWIVSVVAVIAIALWIGLLAHRRLDYSGELWWTFAFSSDAPRMLRASLVTALLAAAFIIYSLMRPRPPEPSLPDATQLARAERAIAMDEGTHGQLALSGDKRLLFHPEDDAFLMYQVRGRSWVALGDPVGERTRAEELVWSFREQVDRHAGWPVFYEVAADQLPLYLDLGLTALKLGEEAHVPLHDFSLEGPARAELRQAHRRSERHGVSFEVLPAGGVAEIMPGLEQISADWLSEKGASEKGFSVGRFSAAYLQRFPLAVVRLHDQPVAFANLWAGAGRQELSIDLMRFGKDAPGGTMDYLFIELLLWGRAQGYRQFNLGMAPLAGLEQHPLAPVWHRVGNFLFEHGEHFYNFEGVRRYKSKFDPEWLPRYLIAPGGLALPRIMLDVSMLIAGGARALLR